MKMVLQGEGHRLALVILADTDWPTLKQNSGLMVAALDAAAPGNFLRLAEPLAPSRSAQPPVKYATFRARHKRSFVTVHRLNF